MLDLNKKSYVAIVQCHIVKERCSGYFCEKALRERSGGFAGYPPEKVYRYVMLTCGGCCGRALQRKLAHLCARLQKHEGIEKQEVVVQLSTCITKASHHGSVCPHLDSLKTAIARLGLDFMEDTRISPRAQARREAGAYTEHKSV